MAAIGRLKVARKWREYRLVYMSEHKGWRVRQEPRNGTWRGEVRVKGGYRTKTFETSAQARDWARGQAATVETGAPSSQLLAPAVAGTAALAKTWQEGLAARGRSPSYLCDVALILGSLAKAIPVLSEAGADLRLEEWLNNIKTNGKGRGGNPGAVSASRRNKYLAVVRAFIHWAIKRKRLARDLDLTVGIEMASVDDFMKPQLSIDDARKLATHAKDSKTLRWCLLMLYAGLRSDEARCLRWEDIDWSGGAILVRMASGAEIKRRRERIVPLQEELASRLKPLSEGKTGAVCGLGRANLGRSFADLMTACKITTEGLSPHSLRHTYAGLMTATGEPTALVGAYLGHSEAKTTMGYTKLAARYVAAVRGWPRGELRLTGV